MKSITKTASQTKKLGKKLGEKIKDGAVVFLHGDLGAGKTTFVQGLAKGLGIDKRINSPTFIVARQYDKFFHVDLYRLKSVQEAKDIGIEQMCMKPNVVCIEWPEIIQDLKLNPIIVRIKSLSEKEREIEII